MVRFAILVNYARSIKSNYLNNTKLLLNVDYTSDQLVFMAYFMEYQMWYIQSMELQAF